jgi:hypothetical protein
MKGVKAAYLKKIDEMYKNYMKQKKIMIGGNNWIVNNSDIYDLSHINLDEQFKIQMNQVNSAPSSQLAF